MGNFIKSKKVFYIIGILVFVMFFLAIGVLQIFLKDKSLRMTNGTINEIKENTSLIERVYLDWWSSSLNKVSSQGVKNVYEFKNTYKNLNIVVRDENVLRDTILNEIIIDGQPMFEYNYEIVESNNGKSIFKISLDQFSKNNSTNITKLLSIYNRYDNVFYNIEVDSFQFRFNISKDLGFIYLNFENYILDFYDKEFKIESNYYSENNQNFIYNFGHVNKNVRLPIVNDLKVSTSMQVINTFFNENTNFTLYNRFGNPIATFGILSSGELKILNSYNLSNVYDIELKDQVFLFDSDNNEDNIFKIEKRENGSVDILNLIDNYSLYFDDNTMKAYKVYNDNKNPEKEFINFKMYRDLRNGDYVFTPNKDLDSYKFYAFNDNKFLSYNEVTNKFEDNDTGDTFIINPQNRIFNIENGIFLGRDNKDAKNYSFTGELEYGDADIFKLNNMNSSIFLKADYDDIKNQIMAGNYIQVLLKNKETGNFLSVNSKTNEATNENLYNDSYLDGGFSYKTAINNLSNFVFEIRTYSSETLDFNLYSKVKQTSLNAGDGLFTNRLIFDKSDDNKVKFTLEKSEGRDTEFKIKDNYGSYLSFDKSDNFAQVTYSGFLQKFFMGNDLLDTFEIYIIDFETLEEVNSGEYISFSSRHKGSNVFSIKVSSKSKGESEIYIDEYAIIRNKEMMFLSGDNLMKEMVITKDYKTVKGIDSSLISRRDSEYLGYRFKILNEIGGAISKN